jgi:hypothetical protein
MIVRHGSTTPFLPRQPGLRTIQGLDLTLLIHRNHHRSGGRMQVQGFTKCGFRPCARQIRPMVEGLTSVNGAKVRVLQWVAATGVDWVIRRTISSMRAGVMVRGLPERGASFSILVPRIDALLPRFAQFSDSPRLISLQGQELGVSRKDLGDYFLKLSRLFDPQADRINPIRGNPLDMLLTVQHEGERPDGMTLAAGAMAGGLAAS